MAHTNQIISDVIGLSSGTLANITGLNRYEDIDRIQQNFALFVINTQDNAKYSTWMEAWKEYKMVY